MSYQKNNLSIIINQSIENINEIHLGRESALANCRKSIQKSSSSIRASHRNQFDEALTLANESKESLEKAKEALKKFHLNINTVFFLDTEKEFCEAMLVYSFLSESNIPTPEDLQVTVSSYLKGLAEASSELRRTSLDSIRKSNYELADKYLGIMNEVTDLLETIDFPEAVTGGLRRTTDQLRSVVERTRGDVTLSLDRKKLENQLENLKETLKNSWTKFLKKKNGLTDQ